MLTAMYPDLAVSDVKKTADFLEEALEFKPRFPYEEDGILHTMVMSHGDLSIIIHHIGQDQPRGIVSTLPLRMLRNYTRI